MQLSLEGIAICLNMKKYRIRERMGRKGGGEGGDLTVMSRAS